MRRDFTVVSGSFSSSVQIWISVQGGELLLLSSPDLHTQLRCCLRRRFRVPARRHFINISSFFVNEVIDRSVYGHTNILCPSRLCTKASPIPRPGLRPDLGIRDHIPLSLFFFFYIYYFLSGNDRVKCDEVRPNTRRSHQQDVVTARPLRG
jgi:hypothetical protein